MDPTTTVTDTVAAAEQGILNTAEAAVTPPAEKVVDGLFAGVGVVDADSVATINQWVDLTVKLAGILLGVLVGKLLRGIVAGKAPAAPATAPAPAPAPIPAGA